MESQEMYDKICDKIDRLSEKLDTKMSDIDKKVQGHEVRIVVLEQNQPGCKIDWKSDIIQLLVKAVVIGAVAIAGLAGAGGILQQILGK